MIFAAAMACALFLCPTHGHAVGTGPSCDTIELVGQRPYDDLVCASIEALQIKDFARAITLFERAMNIPLHETPNFVLFPRLALAYSSAGQQQKAQETLDKAEFALKIFTRILSCIEMADGYRIVKTGDPDLQQVQLPYYEEIANRMCGAAYPSTESLGEIPNEFAHVGNFLAIQLLIQVGVSKVLCRLLGVAIAIPQVQGIRTNGG